MDAHLAAGGWAGGGPGCTRDKTKQREGVSVSVGFASTLPHYCREAKPAMPVDSAYGGEGAGLGGGEGAGLHKR